MDLVQKVAEPVELVKAVFEVALGRQKAVVGVVEGVDVGPEAHMIEDDLEVVQDITLPLSNLVQQIDAKGVQGHDVGMVQSGSVAPVLAVHVCRLLEEAQKISTASVDVGCKDTWFNFRYYLYC